MFRYKIDYVHSYKKTRPGFLPISYLQWKSGFMFTFMYVNSKWTGCIELILLLEREKCSEKGGM